MLLKSKSGKWVNTAHICSVTPTTDLMTDKKVVVVSLSDATRHTLEMRVSDLAAAMDDKPYLMQVLDTGTDGAVDSGT